MSEKINILYVDDEPNNLVSFKAAFRRHYKVFTAESAKEGIEVLKENDIPIIITDQKMPEMTGVEFLEKVVVEFPNSIRMVLTGFSDVDAIIKSINEGQIFRYITKPWDEGYLKMTIDRAVDFFKTQEENRALIKKLEQKVEEQEKIVEKRTKEVYEKNKSITESINYARRIQEAILPSTTILNEYKDKFFVFYKPKDVVSGDFYWWEESQDKFFIAVADCTGHGVPGGFMSMMGMIFINEVYNSKDQITEPNAILDELNRLLLVTISDEIGSNFKDGMDISFGVLDKKTRTLEWSGANNPIYIVRKDAKEVEVIKGNKQPIGNYENRIPFDKHTIQLEKGDTIYLFSDGYADQFGGEDGKKYTYSTFRDTLVKASKIGLGEQPNFFEKDIKKWMGTSEEQVDDICIVGVKV